MDEQTFCMEGALSIHTIKGAVVDGFEIMDKFSAGGFSVVHFAKHIETGTFCAAKIIDLDVQTDDAFEGIMCEISVFMQTVHKNIVSLYRLSLVDSILIFFLEYAPNGTLLSYVNNKGGLPEMEVRRLFFQMFSAVRYLQMNHFIVHRDLKLENFLMDKNNNIKLTDYGLSSTFYCNVMSGRVGSPGYTAPEVVMGVEYSEKCDVFSLGVCLYAMITARLPFTLDDDIDQLVTESSNIQFGSKFSPMLADLIKQMVDPRPSSRFSLSDIARHPWMMGIPQPGKVIPKPVVFYRVKKFQDILKFKRRNIQINEQILIESCEARGVERETLEQELLDGDINDNTCFYYCKLCPCHDEPRLPKVETVQNPPASARTHVAPPSLKTPSKPHFPGLPLTPRNMKNNAGLKLPSLNPQRMQKSMSDPHTMIKKPTARKRVPLNRMKL